MIHIIMIKKKNYYQSCKITFLNLMITIELIKRNCISSLFLYNKFYIKYCFLFEKI